jgi:alpha-amylase/alpha-mannosidase (GH57 family)
MTDQKCFVCIHGHFYQPPRENPWLDAVPCEPSARPYRDWNRRITRECYGPNAAARIPGREGGILSLVNNYEHMSFNFGPTLLTWLSRNDPWTYRRILEADRNSAARHDGHGNAVAQVYNHIILPLALTRDKRTQIVWGIRDFKYRFGRMPEGMWLAETAVDNETLSLMAGEGIRFTILSPEQAEAVRPLGSKTPGSWKRTNPEILDTTRPYRVFPSARRDFFIDVFFYNGPVSRAVAYEGLLGSGEQFLERIEGASGHGRPGPRIITIATDGESYGHHFKFGDMALAWLLNNLDGSQGLSALNFGAFLERFPPVREVKVREASAWSCAHGVERWRADCGCNVTGTPGWDQAWRTPLRQGLDRLADSLGGIFETKGKSLFHDPWSARNDYIDLLLDFSAETRKDFSEKHLRVRQDEEVWGRAVRLLESQRMCLYMFTSCGWFFDDISGLESVQVMLYAARAIDLAGGEAKEDLETRLLKDLSLARSNVEDAGTGADIYARSVKAARMGPARLAAHVVCAGVPERPNGGCSIVSRVKGGLEIEKHTGPASGRVRVVEPNIPGSHAFLFRRTSFGCELEPLDEAGVTVPGFEETATGPACFSHRDLLPGLLHEMADSAASNFQEEFSAVLETREQEFTALVSLMDGGERRCISPRCRRWLGLAVSGRIVKSLSEAGFEDGSFAEDLRSAVETAVSWELKLDCEYLAQEVLKAVTGLMKRLTDPLGEEVIHRIMEIMAAAASLGLPLDLWGVQNMYHDLRNSPDFKEWLSESAPRAFGDLGERLGFREY